MDNFPIEEDERKYQETRTDILTDRQMNRENDRQMDREVDRQTDGLMDGMMDGWVDDGWMMDEDKGKQYNGQSEPMTVVMGIGGYE